ncbi:uncharacterized protein LOC131656533 [Vicia villosa]|uniref:uncharacterized protein LOC131656533 n=1 Tax=Vicia villosa TaxID=3911 RepID=UPI00273B572E|nr:uncharacterized protein LOC131656533 [Vicia villosa]
MNNISFHSRDSVDQWKYVYQRRIALERDLGKEALECSEIMDFITHGGLINTVSRFGKCYEGLIKEFVVNFLVDYADPRSKDFRKVYVRGRCVEFSSAVINRYMNTIEDEQGELEVTDNQVHKVITSNQHAGSCAIKMSIAFPTLIFGIILSQHPGILCDTDAMPKRESTLSLHFKLFTSKHVPDISMTSASTENKTSTKAEMISELVEVYKELDGVIRVSSARKDKFEKMIKDLKKDDSADEEVDYEGGKSDDKEDSSEATESAVPEDS